LDDVGLSVHTHNGVAGGSRPGREIAAGDHHSGPSTRHRNGVLASGGGAPGTSDMRETRTDSHTAGFRPFLNPATGAHIRYELVAEDSLLSPVCRVAG
jgi:hypothetical protein